MEHKDHVRHFLINKLHEEGIHGWRVQVQPLVASPRFLVALTKGAFFDMTNMRHTEPMPYMEEGRHLLDSELCMKAWSEVQNVLVDEFFDRDVLDAVDEA